MTTMLKQQGDLEMEFLELWNAIATVSEELYTYTAAL
jgi:hypothetical protein